MSAPQAAQAAGQVAQGAAPFWRNAGMTYVAYANACAVHLRKCLKEPFKSEAANREQVHYKFSEWENGIPQISAKICLWTAEGRKHLGPGHVFTFRTAMSDQYVATGGRLFEKIAEGVGVCKLSPGYLFLP